MGEPEQTDVDEAIAIIRECREIHVTWADWQEANPNWRELVTPDSPGGPEHHREWVGKYERVLRVLGVPEAKASEYVPCK